ncbi:MAG: hypothetical protein H6Q42_361 [Deltaproteobacteria bacterium]|nr:hypothetical protein [Deltaproteobacteria bacterium]
MERLFFRPAVILILFLFAVGCATITPVQKEGPPEVSRPETGKKESVLEKETFSEPDKQVPEVPGKEMLPDPFKDLPEKYRLRAREFEQKKDWPNALFCWEIVNSFRPDDLEAGRRLQEIGKAAATQYEIHFQSALEHLRKENPAAARREFLMALAYRPDDAQTLNYVKPKVLEEDYVIYVTKKDDTLWSVAQQVYRNESMQFLVGYFNDLKAGGPIKPATVLKMPRLQAALAPKGGTSSAEMVEKAKSFLRARNYEEAVSHAEKALEYAPKQREAREVKNAAYYEWGTELLQRQEDRKALRMFKKADENYKDVKDIIARIEKRLQKQRETAEDHYLRGVRHFLSQELNEAAREWETTLSLDPQHPRAKRDLERVRRLQMGLPLSP